MARRPTGKDIYQRLKSGQKTKYFEEIHCPLVIDIMSDPDKGTVSAFCVEAGIGDTTFYRWTHAHPLFNECYRYGAMVSRENWEDAGRRGQFLEEFNTEIWKLQGSARYGIGRTNRVRVHIDPESTPFEQYKQLMAQSALGDFSAAEIKQLMESINIGCRAHEQFELQKDINRMQDDIKKMEYHRGNNISPIDCAKKTN